MKIATFGFRGPTDQISRIEKGFLEQDHIIAYDNPDLIYSNNPDFSEPLQFGAIYPNAKKIFTILDVPNHHPEYPFKLIESQLARANAVCTISKYTQSEVKRVYGFDSTVIYQPLKKTFRIPEIKKDIFLLFCGRVNDPNKRFDLVIETTRLLRRNLDEIHVCGPEQPPCGTYHGLVSDEKLNLLYNRSKYYISATKNAGIELCPLEGIFAGCIPIGCSDNPTSYEFIPDFIAQSIARDLAAKINEIEQNRVEISQNLVQNAPLRYKDLNYLEVSKKIISLYNNLLCGENQSAPRQEGDCR